MSDGSGLGIYSAKLLATAQTGDIQLLVGDDSHKTTIEVLLSPVAQCFDAGIVLQGTCVIPNFGEINK